MFYHRNLGTLLNFCRLRKVLHILLFVILGNFFGLQLFSLVVGLPQVHYHTSSRLVLHHLHCRHLKYCYAMMVD